MSAALALDVPARLPDGHPSSPSRMPVGRPRLRLVPTGPQIETATGPVRATRRGRLVRTALVMAVVLAVTWTLVTAVTAGAVSPHVVTVTSGQTLSQIAAQQLPDLPVRQGVAALQLANGLNSSDIHAGQVLTIPAAG